MLTRREFSWAVGVAAFGQGKAARPNIILYLADDHGWDIAGCYGNSAVQTPNLDALARQGMRFTKAFAASPTCSPSRAILYTGLHSARNGLMGNHTGSRKGIKSIAHYLKDLGYRVVLANKTHVQPVEVFDFEYVKATLPPVPGRLRKYRLEGLDTKTIDELLAEHARNRASQPLCLICADSGPHVVWEKNHTYKPEALPLPPITVDTPLTRAAMANYYQDITSTDARLGEVMTSAKKHGFEENTLFLYTSDQGPEWPHSKWTVYDSGLRVPFVARWPGKIKAHTVTDAMISFTDVTPTLVDVAGGKPVPGLDGTSFQEVLLGKKKSFRTEIYASHTGDGEMNVFPQRGLRDLRYKYVLNLHPERRWTTHFTLVGGIPGSHKDVYDTWVERARSDAKAAKLIETLERHAGEELYDTEKDPWELHNLAGQPAMAAVLEKMRARMKQFRRQIGDSDES
ncbi:MAG: sulfatase [Acidobacteria bacterium]|nr:sulfatase [Acidobacteriota bacterium]